MKINKIYLLRLINPLMFFIGYLILKKEIILGIVIGYLFCWLYGIHYALNTEGEDK